MYYTSERNHQIILELLKHHGIRKIVASPGGTNVTFVASVQQDPYFEVYSSVDERSAAYIACGMAAECGEPIVLSCTGATSARNYSPGLTEAFYRKLPILAITSSMPIERIGHNFPQMTDRTNIANDIAKLSVHVPIIKDKEDEWACMVRINQAMLELKHRGYGPVHINLETSWGAFNAEKIEPVQYIDRVNQGDMFPSIEAKRIGIFVGAHCKWGNGLTTAVDLFCEKYNAVVIGDHTSNYKGKYRINSSLIATQLANRSDCLNIDLLIHIGDISGAYLQLYPKEVWRVNVDGKVCDTFKKLRYVFEMEEISFFEKYNNVKESYNKEFFEYWKNECTRLEKKIPENVPFSNIYVAKKISSNLPRNSVLHLGILNSLRSWNLFEIDDSIAVYSNTGGFGIDGCISSMIGASVVATDKLFFGVVGDLAFFYDINSLGNRHISKNIRLIVINNGIGQEFKNYGNGAAQFGDDTNIFIAAEGHYGRCSKTLVKGYAESLGFKYMTANDKKTFNEIFSEFISKDVDKPILFEIFTNSKDETEALKIFRTLDKPAESNMKKIVKTMIGDNGINTIKSVLKR